MNRSATATVAVVIVLVLVVVGVIAVVGLGTDGATAVEVGSQKVSREDVNDELRALADNQKLVSSVGADRVTTTRGSVVADAAAAVVMNGTVQEAIIKEYLDRKDEKITAADQAAGKELFPQTGVGQFAAGFPKWYRERSAERLAAYSAFARVTGLDLQSETAEADIASELRPFARKVGVKVDPRYGRYRARRVTVVPYTLPAGLLDPNASN